jgi:triosephosphate isomerase
MRKIMVAGNWKMNKSSAEAKGLVSEILTGMKLNDGVEMLVCPPFFSVPVLAEMLKGKDIFLGSQNLYYEESGAFTGETSPAMTAEFCTHVIVGHSERRAYFGDTDEAVNKKTKAAMAHGLIPIVCVGETLAQREAGETEALVGGQLRAGLAGVELSTGKELILAYEPVWAIGTGVAATTEDAVSVIGGMIRPALVDLYGEAIASQIQILYGGSVKPENAYDYFKQADIDGALIGGAALKADAFLGIAKAANEVKG